MPYKCPSVFPIRKWTILCLPRSRTPRNVLFKSIRKPSGWQPVTQGHLDSGTRIRRLWNIPQNRVWGLAP